MALRIGDWPENYNLRCSTHSEITVFNQLAREVLFANNIAMRQTIIDAVGLEAANKVPSVVPRRYDMGINIDSARKMTTFQLINAVRTGGEWDYKKNGHPELADFGNWNYGVVTKAWSEQLSPFSDVFQEFFEEMALREQAHIKSGRGPLKMIGVGLEEIRHMVMTQ